MKNVLVIAFLSFSVLASGRIFYVQDPAYNDNASDSNRGDDLDYPWATWQRAFDSARPGDTVYFRGGTWYPTTDLYGSVVTYNPRGGHGYNGTYARPVCFFAYPPDVAQGNMPVLDCRSSRPSTNGHVGLNIRSSGYVHFKGLTVKNVRSWPRASGEMWCAGIMIDEYLHLTLEHMTVSHVGGAGIVSMGGDTLWLINVDSHNNCDTLDVELPGNDGDGFTIMHEGPDTQTDAVLYMHGCRAWNNADDGFGISFNKQMDIKDCWAWNNGDLEGDGNGFKYRYSYIRDTWKRKTYNCIAAYNRRAGFTDLNLHAPMGPHMEYLNNSTYRCERGFGSSPGNQFNCTQHPGEAVYRNNISFESTGPYPAAFTACDRQYPSYTVQDHNTWIQTGERYYTAPNPDYNLMADDFISLDTAQLRWPRGADGSLPDIAFMQLKPSSDLVDRGVDVGLAYYGAAPDLGAHERNSFSVEIVSPHIYQIFREGNQISLIAKIYGDEGSIEDVLFYGDDGETLLGMGTKVSSDLWEFTWEANEQGYKGFRAEAYGSQGETAISSILRIRVRWPLHSGLHKEELTQSCKILPNPNDGLFFLELEEPLQADCDIQVISVTGQLVAVERIGKNMQLKEVDLSALPPGMYNIRLSNRDDASTVFAEGVKMIIN